MSTKQIYSKYHVNVIVNMNKAFEPARHTIHVGFANIVCLFGNNTKCNKVIHFICKFVVKIFING